MDVLQNKVSVHHVGLCLSKLKSFYGVVEIVSLRIAVYTSSCKAYYRQLQEQVRAITES